MHPFNKHSNLQAAVILNEAIKLFKLFYYYGGVKNP
jgi:hypothetical protein